MVLNLNLSILRSKLEDAEEGPGWDFMQCNGAERKYKRFLILNIKYPDKAIVPDKEIDTFWHAHILDTRKYHADCDAIFGGYFHHYPYFGLKGKEDKMQLDKAFAETQELWKKEFEQDMQGKSTKPPRQPSCKANCAGTCRS